MFRFYNFTSSKVTAKTVNMKQLAMGRKAMSSVLGDYFSIHLERNNNQVGTVWFSIHIRDF